MPRLWPRGGGGGGSTSIQWVELKSCDQGSGTAVAPGADASGFRSSGGHNTTTGVTEIVLSAGTTIADGYREAVCWWSEDLLTLIPDFDPDLHCLLIEIDKLTTPPGTVELNLWAGVLDGQPSGTASGACFFVGHLNDLTDNSGLMGATTLTFSTAGDHIESCMATIQITNDAGTYETRLFGRNRLSDGAESGGANWGAGQNLTGSPSTWKICWGYASRSVDSKSGLVGTMKVRVAKQLLPVELRPAAPARGAKPATGPGSSINVVLFGDSIGRGQGGQTATGALPANVNVRDDNVVQASWPNTAPVPQAGFMPQLAADLQAAGYETVNIARRSQAAAEANVTIDQLLRRAISDCKINFGEPHVVVYCCMTNDCQTTVERDSAEARLGQSYKAVEIACPLARILHMEPMALVSTGSHDYVEEVKDTIRALCAESPSRAAILGEDLATTDGVHPQAASYNTQASRAVTAYLAMP